MLFKTLKIIITTIFFLGTIQSAFSNEIIIPIKKPIISSNKNNEKISNNFIIPVKKPTIEKKQESDEIDIKSNKKRITKINGIIIPKNKPLIVKKQRSRTLKKSIYYSERDINYARQAIKFMEKGNWQDAKKVAKKSQS